MNNSETQATLERHNNHLSGFYVRNHELID